MPKIEITGFDGLVPRSSPTMLGDNQAQRAENVKLYSKELRYWRGPTEVYAPVISDVETIYRIDADPDPIWLTWQAEVDVVPGPLADVTERRLYYTGDGAPKKTNLELARTGGAPYPQGWLDMGVPVPTSAPSVVIGTEGAPKWSVNIDSQAVANDSGTVTASRNFQSTPTAAADAEATISRVGSNISVGLSAYVVAREDGAADQTPTRPVSVDLLTSGGLASSDRVTSVTPDVETRAYVYTYVSQFGSITEESAPSPPSALLDVYMGQPVTVAGFAPTPDGAHAIYARRIYRTVAGATTDSYQFVAEIPLADTSFVDNLPVAKLGEVLTTVGWLPPPEDLKGLITHPSGALIGFVGNTVYFSEPFFPHAWPRAYALTLAYDIVGLGVIGTTVVAATERAPYMITGPYPGAMGVEQVPIVEPCIAKRSITSDEHGVTYASPNGLVGIGPAMRGLMTTKLFRRDEWQDTQPETLRAVVYDGKYFGVREGLSALVLSRDDIPALSQLSIDARTLYVDSLTAKLYFVGNSDGKIYEADADEFRPHSFEWTSKRFVLPQGMTFSALILDADYDQMLIDDTYNLIVAEITEANNAAFAAGPLGGTINAEPLNTYTVNGSILRDLPLQASVRSVQVSISADGRHVATLTPTEFRPLRLPPFRVRELELQITGNINTRSLALATTVAELRQ